MHNSFAWRFEKRHGTRLKYQCGDVLVICFDADFSGAAVCEASKVSANHACADTAILIAPVQTPAPSEGSTGTQSSIRGAASLPKQKEC